MNGDDVRILKFGGSSVGDPAVMRRAAMITTAALSRNGRPGSGAGVVVVSALGGVTRQLLLVADEALEGDESGALDRVGSLRTHHTDFLDRLDLGSDETRVLQELLDQCFVELDGLLGAPRSERMSATERAAYEDSVLAFGEMLASRLFWGVLQSLGVHCAWMDARDFLVTDGQFRAAKPNLALTKERLAAQVGPALDDDCSVIVPGFVGATDDGQTTTMGFEASDLTATVIASALAAREVQIWTDVSGVMSADPRVVSEVRPLPHLSYDSAREMALLGARVLHPDTMRPARAAGIAVRVVNCSRPGEAGTLIDGNDLTSSEPSDVVVTSRSGQSVLRVVVTDDFGEPVLKVLRHVVDRLLISDALFATHPVAPNQTEVIIVMNAGSNLSELKEAARRFGETSVTSGWSAVSVVASRAERPEWPDSGDGVLAWDGLGGVEACWYQTPTVRPLFAGFMVSVSLRAKQRGGQDYEGVGVGVGSDGRGSSAGRDGSGTHRSGAHWAR